MQMNFTMIKIPFHKMKSKHSVKPTSSRQRKCTKQDLLVYAIAAVLIASIALFSRDLVGDYKHPGDALKDEAALAEPDAGLPTRREQRDMTKRHMIALRDVQALYQRIYGAPPLNLVYLQKASTLPEEMLNDAWGNPISWDQALQPPSFRSAGPDGQMFTKDDLTLPIKSKSKKTP